MDNFLQKYNTDDVHSRAVIIALINLLNSKVQFQNVLSDTDFTDVTVPFFYSMTGDDRFLQDYFLEWNQCVHPKIADGNYDVIPRGIVTLTSNTINTSAMTHRFVRAKYVKEVDGQLQTYNSFLNSIPLSMSFDIVVMVDTNLDAFKIQQSILETFYKTQVFSIGFRGFRIPCQAGFPEDYSFDKTFEFTYETENRLKLTFTIALETYYPVIDPTTTRLNSNRITGIGNSLTGVHGNEITSLALDGGTGSAGGYEINYSILNEAVSKQTSFTFTQPTPGSKYFSGNILPIHWSNSGTVNRVNLYYSLGDDDWKYIARDISNTGSYDWHIPFFDASGITFATDPVRTHVSSENGNKANIRAIINENGEVDQILVFDGGYSYTGADTIQISPLIGSGSTQSITQPNIIASVIDGSIVGCEIYEVGSGFAPSPINTIQIKIENAGNSKQFQIYASSQSFTGNVDPFNPANIRKITNIHPTINELISSSANLQGTISGPGLQNGSNITSVDSINNTLIIDRDVTLLITDGTYKLENNAALFEIQ